MTQLWKLLDISQHDVFFVGRDDVVYYAREYISGRNYEASDTNQLISNFKKPVERRGRPEWQYKTKAIKQFAKELSLLLDNKTLFVLSAIPSSISKIDSSYDSRIEDTLKELQKIKKNIIVEEPISIKETLRASHLGGTRNPDTLYDNMSWRGIKSDTNHIILVDDVITTGSHFKACKRMILDYHKDMAVIGIFWAKTTWDNIS